MTETEELLVKALNALYTLVCEIGLERNDGEGYTGKFYRESRKFENAIYDLHHLGKEEE